MKLWKQRQQGKASADSRHGTSSDNLSPYKRSGFSSSSFSDFRDLPSSSSSAAIGAPPFPSMKKSTSRTSIDIQSRFSNFINKSTSSLDLSRNTTNNLFSGSSRIANTASKFSRPRTTSTGATGNPTSSNTPSSISPNKLLRPRKWVHSLLASSSGTVGSDQLETTAEARQRASFDQSRIAPAPVSTLVLSPSSQGIADPSSSAADALSSANRRVYTIDSGLQRITSTSARSASIYSSHLSSATRSTPDLPSGSVIRHRENGAMQMEILPPLTSFAARSTAVEDDRSPSPAPLVVRNLDEAPRGTFTPSIPLPSGSAQLHPTSRMQNPWSGFDPSNRNEEEDHIDASIAHDRSSNKLDAGEQAVLQMLDNMSGAVGSIASAPTTAHGPAPASPYATATPGTLARSKSFATTTADTRFHSPASQYSQDFKSPYLAGTSSPGAGVREAIRIRELLDQSVSSQLGVASASAVTSASRSTLSPNTLAFLDSIPSNDSVPKKATQTSSGSFYHRTEASSSSSASISANQASKDIPAFKRIQRIPVPASDSAALNDGMSQAASTSALYTRRNTTASQSTNQLVSPVDSSLLGSSANATSLWSKPSHVPDTPSTSQDPNSPFPSATSASSKSKWPISSTSYLNLPNATHKGVNRSRSKRLLYSLEAVGTPASEKSTFNTEAGGTTTEEDEEEELLSNSQPDKPRFRRQTTDNTMATSIFSSGEDKFRTSQNSLQKEVISEDEAIAGAGAALAASQGMKQTHSSSTAATTATTSSSEVLPNLVSMSSSMQAIKSSSSKAVSLDTSTAPPTSTSMSAKGSASSSSLLPQTDASGTQSSFAASAASVSSSAAALLAAAVARVTPSRVSPAPSIAASNSKVSIPGSPTKTKDLIKMFESNSASASPSERSLSVSQSATPRRRGSPTKGLDADIDSQNSTPKRQTPLALSISNSNFAATASSSTALQAIVNSGSPVDNKLRSLRIGGARTTRRSGLVSVGANQGASFFDAGHGDDHDDENADPESLLSAAASNNNSIRSASGRFRSSALSSATHSRSQSTPGGGDGFMNNLAVGVSFAPSSSRNSYAGDRGGTYGSSSGSGSGAADAGNASSLGRKGAFRNSVLGFMGVLSGRNGAAGGGADEDQNMPSNSLGKLSNQSLLFARRHSARSDQEDNVSTASAATQGTTASYKRKLEEGTLPLTSTTAIEMSGEPVGTKPLRAGVLYYFNVHDPQPRWLRVKAVLLPSAIAMSWIPTGGGRENVVLDLRACREVHSVPSPDHPSSVSDIGAACARKQGLDQITPFQLIFDDGVERLAADSARDRVQWVTSIWDVTGVGSPRNLNDSSDHPDRNPTYSTSATSGHSPLYKRQSIPVKIVNPSFTSPAHTRIPSADLNFSRPFVSPNIGAADSTSPRRPWSIKATSSSNNEEAIDRIGSIWKSELSSDLTSRDAHQRNLSFGEALASVDANGPPPPVPPKETKDGRDTKQLSSSPTKATAIKANAVTSSRPRPVPANTEPATALAVTASSSAAVSANSPVKTKVRSWQKPALDLSKTGLVHEVAPRTPTLVTPAAAETVRSTPASLAAADEGSQDKSQVGRESTRSESQQTKADSETHVQSAGEHDPKSKSLQKETSDNPEDPLDDTSPIESSPDMDGYESAHSHNSALDLDDFGPRTPASEAVFNWSKLDRESELDPSDSASQRPARSEYGTIKSNVSLDPQDKIRHPRSKSNSADAKSADADKQARPSSVINAGKAHGDEADLDGRTPAQRIRDSTLGTNASDGQPETLGLIQDAQAARSNRLGTVIEETQSQAQSTRLNASLQSSPLSARQQQQLAGAGAKIDESVLRSIAAATASANGGGTDSKSIRSTKSVLSSLSNGSINSQDVSKLLEYLEDQQRERLSRDQQLEEQIRGFQQIVSSLQKKNSTSTSGGSNRDRRRASSGSVSTSGAESKMTTARASLSGRDSELAAMQENLDRVLDLVTNVVSVASPSIGGGHAKGRSESAVLNNTDLRSGEEEAAEMARVEAILAKLLRKMQISDSSEEAAQMTPRSKSLVREAISARDPSLLDEWDRMPTELKGTELMKSMQERAQYGHGNRDGRLDAIQSDFANKSMERVGSAPDATERTYGNIGVDLRRRSATFSRRVSSGTSVQASVSGATEADGTSIGSRIPPRDWSSERGVPSPPPNSEWDARSLLLAGNLSRPASRATVTATPRLASTGTIGRTPVADFRLSADPSAASPQQHQDQNGDAKPRPVLLASEPSYGSLDMEAEIRRRRAQTLAANGVPVPSGQVGGWYTPKVAQTTDGDAGGSNMEPQNSSSSITVSNMIGQGGAVDKPVPPTPSVRWAAGDVTEPGSAAPSKTADGLGFSLSSTAVPGGDAQFVGPPPTPGAGSMSANSVRGSLSGIPAGAGGELATILHALKQNELARQTQLQQQTEISRYLNELNAWLEKDVVDRSKEWRTLASGVTQLHDELKALKEGRTLPVGAAPGQTTAATAPAAQISDPTSHPNPRAIDASTPNLLQSGATGAVPPPSQQAPYGSLIVMGDSGNKPAASIAGGDSRRRPAGTRKWNSKSAEAGALKPNDATTWYKPDDDSDRANQKDLSLNLKSKASRAAAIASGALLVRSALREWERFKATQRSEGKPEDPLPKEATGNAEVDAKIPLPAEILRKLQQAADQNDNVQIAHLIRDSATQGYGTQAIIELTKYVESKAPPNAGSDDGSDAHLDGDTLMPTPSPHRTRFAVDPEEEDKVDGKSLQTMQTPIPAATAAAAKAKEKAKSVAMGDEGEEAESSSAGPTTSALALAVEEILKHLLERKEEEKKKSTESEAKLLAALEASRKASDVEREKSLLALKEREKAELVDLLYSRISADKAASEAKAKELDPKSAIESLVAAINTQREQEAQTKQTSEAVIRQMTQELLKTTSEQNSKLIEAVGLASREMLRSNIQVHAEEFKRILHKEVTNMFEDVGKIREAKRHLEFEIADLWSIKSRHLLQNGNTAGLPIGYNVPGSFPTAAGGQQAPAPAFPQPMTMPMPHITNHIHSPSPNVPMASIHPIPTTPTAPTAAATNTGIESLRAQKKAVKAALRQAVADSTTTPAPAAAPVAATVTPAPAAPAPVVAAPVQPTGFLARQKDVLNPFSINFGPRAPTK